MANDKAVSNRIRVCAALADARDGLIAGNRDLRRKQNHLSHQIRSAEARVDRLLRSVARLRARREGLKKEMKR